MYISNLSEKVITKVYKFNLDTTQLNLLKAFYRSDPTFDKKMIAFSIITINDKLQSITKHTWYENLNTEGKLYFNSFILQAWTDIEKERKK